MLVPSLLAVFALILSAQGFVVSRPRFSLISTSPHRVSQQEEYSTSSSSHDGVKSEYAAISPGSEVRIKVGNVELARKAWKKRRRSGSPILIPCSILDVDETTMVLDNIVYIIQKFGIPMSESAMEVIPEGYKSKDVCLSMSELNLSYRKHLGTSLAKHAVSLGMETARDLVESLMTNEVQAKLDVRLFPSGDNLWLLTHISRYRGHRLSEEAGLLQFENNIHTGMTKLKTASGYENLPLSAALRVSQRSVDNGLVSEGSIYKAQVFALDPLGDGGSPLLKLSMNTERKMSKNKRIIEFVDPRMIQIQLEQLIVGAGPFKGKVTRVSNKTMAAFVDIGVGRSVKNGQMRKILGMLRFDDLNKVSSNPKGSVAKTLERDMEDEEELEKVLNSMDYDIEDDNELEDDEGDDLDEDILNDLLAKSDLTNDDEEDDDFISEEEEDITHLVSLKDGLISYTDPETGEVTSLGTLMEEDEDTESDEDDDDDAFFAELFPEEKINTHDEWNGDGEDVVSDSVSRNYVKVGDEISVYVQAVSKQSGRFMLTARPIIHKMKEVKKETEAEKKLDRLIAKMGGDIANILELAGTECDGIIKATSKTGNWLYVEPRFQDLPVGVAQLAEGISIESLSQGDSVRIRLEGIDESRGQLAMTVIEKQ